MKHIPLPRVAMSDCEVTLNKGLAAALFKESRTRNGLAAKSMQRHGSDPLQNAIEAQQRLDDAEAALEVLKSERHAVQQAIACLRGHDFDETDHQLVKTAETIFIQAAELKAVDADLADVQLGEQIDALHEMLEAIDTELDTATSRRQKALDSTRRLGGQCYAADGVDIGTLVDHHVAMPKHWQLPILEDEDIGMATGRNFISPVTDRAEVLANVISHAAKTFLSEDSRRHREAAKTKDDQVTRELISELREALV